MSRDAVLSAIAEFDSLGRDEFLAKYGFGRARTYFVVLNDKHYDSKAIAGAAHGYMPDRDALRPKDFSGGDATVAKALRALDFDVQRHEPESVSRQRPPSWAWPELVLACELTERSDWHELDVNHPEVHKLSRLLRQLDIHPGAADDDRFRSTGSVRSKMMNLSHCHPSSTRRGSNGGALDREVVDAFVKQPERMRAYARELRQMGLAEQAAETAGLGRSAGTSQEDPRIDLVQFRPSSEDVLISAIKAHFRTRTNEQARLLNDFQLAAITNGLKLEKDSETGDLVLSRGRRRWIVAPKVVQNGNATAAVQTAIGSLTYTRHFFYRNTSIDVVALFTEPIGQVYVNFLESLGIRAVWRLDDVWDGSPSARQDALVQSQYRAP